MEEAEGLGGSGRGSFFRRPPVEGVEGLGHDDRGARAAVSAGGSDMIAGPALCVRHDRIPRGKSEEFTIPFPSFSPQGLTVSDSTHNAGSHNARYVKQVSIETLIGPRDWRTIVHANG